MFAVLLLVSFTMMVSAAPALNVLSPYGGATQAPNVQPVEGTNQKSQTPAPLSPGLEQQQQQAHPGLPQQPVLQGGPQAFPSLQQYTWSPLGGTPVMMPLQPNIQESLPANQPLLPQQPLVFPPYGYLTMFLSPYTHQQFSPYRFPSPLPQTPANAAANSPLPPAEAAAVAAPSGDAPQPVQQNGQIMYMLQQPMSSTLGSLSSEELEIAAKMSQLGVYVPSVLTNLQAGGVQPAIQAAGLADPDRPGAGPTDGTPSAAGPRPQPSADRLPVGLEKAAPAADTVQTSVQPKVQSSQRNLARSCDNKQQ